MNSKEYAEFLESCTDDPVFVTEGLLIEFTEQICYWMEEKKISRSELARRLGKSRAYVTRILKGNSNFTIGSLAKVAIALGVEPVISLKDREIKFESMTNNHVSIAQQCAIYPESIRPHEFRPWEGCHLGMRTEPSEVPAA
jgi:transcriptional regulator with XRE-family HTH domain